MQIFPFIKYGVFSIINVKVKVVQCLFFFRIGYWKWKMKTSFLKKGILLIPLKNWFDIHLNTSFLTRSSSNIEPVLLHSGPEGVTSTEGTQAPVTETEEPATSTTMPEPQYSPVKCGGNGFYQVGEGCYSFTFYRSVKYSEAERFCNVRNASKWDRLHPFCPGIGRSPGGAGHRRGDRLAQATSGQARGLEYLWEKVFIRTSNVLSLCSQASEFYRSIRDRHFLYWWINR